MPDEPMTTDTRLDAALTAMRQPPAVRQGHAARVAAHAVLANAPIARAASWWTRSAAALLVVALGAGALSVARRSTTETDGTTAGTAPVTEVRVALLPAMATIARPIVFELEAPDAHSVQILGDFNQWSRDSNVMQRGSDGRWRTTTMLPPGRYVYAYLVDGRRFVADPLRDAVTDADFGVTGSELVVGDAP
ncbi:MAG: isoamylase early set domain-containing protein [Gemmatimonadaceae bacterium]|nr:isoamylase early set domain-containing protein [Gemmatimonadaceae bacterium]